jgi:hypothetical protein
MILLLAALALLTSAGSAYAAPLIAPIVAAVLPFLGATGVAIVSSLVVAGISLGVSYLLRPKAPKEQEGGVELDVSFDPLHPQTLIVGRAVTGGSMIYRETFGPSNKALIEIVSIADHPCEGLVKVFIEGQEAVYDEPDPNGGFLVEAYGNFFVGFNFHDGSQTTADAYAVGALGSHPDRPWTSNHVGHGRTYSRIRYIYSPEKVPGPLPWKWVVDGIKLYDPRLDTTAGGSGSHRWDDLDTHEFTANLAVIAYNILRGIRVKNSDDDLVHFYGLENTPAENLPFDNWVTAMNEADTQIDLEGTTLTEPQFHGGLEIPVDLEPLAAIKEILKATGGRLTEVGGIYKLYLGAPGIPVATFDDGIIPANRSDLFQPIRPLEEQTTYISGQFLSPDDGWIEKTPPPRIDTDRETRIGRRIESSLKAPMVQSGAHMQRVMQQILNRVGRERRHSLPLPPALFGVEPGDVLEWNSDRNGYVDKLFEVESAEIDNNLISVVHLLEVEAADYDWEPSDEVAQSTGSLTQARPDPKIIAGFTAEGFLHEGDSGSSRPAIRLIWTPPDDEDVIGVALQIRRASDPADVVTLPSIDDREGVEAGEVIILSGLAPSTAYEVRARFKTFTGFATEWSLWIPVTTPAAGVGPGDLSPELTALLDYVQNQFPVDLFLIRQQIADASDALQTAIAVMAERDGQINIGVGVRYAENQAAAELALSAAATANSAIAGFFVDLFAQTAQGEAEGLIRFIAAALPEGAVASYAIEVKASFGQEFEEAGIYLDVGAFENGATSRIRLVADTTNLEDGEGNVRRLNAAVIADEPIDCPIDVNDEVRADLSQNIPVCYTLVDDDCEVQFPIGARLGFPFWHIFEQDGTGGHTVTYDHSAIITPAPTVDDTPGVVTVLQGIVTSIVPPEMTYAPFGEPGQTTAGSSTVFAISPAVDGNLVWNLATQGPLEITVPGTYTVIPLGVDLQCTVTLFGPGGSTGGSSYDSSSTNASAGNASTFQGMSAGPGGTGERSFNPNNESSQYGTAGAGGTASGGDTNTNGSAGIDGGPLSEVGSIGGRGAAAPSGGGALVEAPNPGTNTTAHANPGNAPGGGASGSARGPLSSAPVDTRGKGGGGGSGAKCVKAFGAGALDQGVEYTLVVGDSGAAGTGPAPNSGSNGARGGAGKAIIST